VFSVVPCASAAEPFLKKGDVIALVGGEDMVVAGELGYLEILLTRALPEHRLRFRCLAWEGDTVFEQRRDLNFPPLEAQLDQVGATVVLCQFGQMESLAAGSAASGRVGVPPAGAGVPPARTSDPEKTAQVQSRPEDRSGRMPEPAGGTPTLPERRAYAPGLPEFIAAYEKLIERMRAGGKRRIVVVMPYGVERNLFIDRAQFLEATRAFRQATIGVARRAGAKFIIREEGDENPFPIHVRTRDGVHFDRAGQLALAHEIARQLEVPGWRELSNALALYPDPIAEGKPLPAKTPVTARLEVAASEEWMRRRGPDPAPLLALIRAKNREIDALAAQLARP
jgi:hypothetical protein